MLSGDLNVTLADAEGASSPSSSTDLSPPDSEPSDLRSAARRMYLGTLPGDTSRHAAACRVRVGARLRVRVITLASACAVSAWITQHLIAPSLRETP